MLFNSFEFLYFFISVTIFYFLLPDKWRWILLLAASCFFYMFFKPEYILILLFTIVIDYYAGILIEKQSEKKKKKRYLVMSLVANIGVLAVFKYYNFLNDNISGLCELFGMKNSVPYLNIILPIGLSFHTFQAMSYTIEVYRGNQKAERHFGIYSLYVMFYPQLVAGPIERPQNILHQFYKKHPFSLENAVLGSNLIILGLFKKVVIADRLAVYVNQVYGHLDTSTTVSAWLAAIFFSFQIYCDFSGYSDIARGTAKFMGYDLMINFDRPYLSRSVSEFWTRWHISLSSWFKDYLYIPLGGNRVSKLKWYRNIFIVFLISGLWHGANFTFIVWGGLHAIYILVESVFLPYTGKLLNKPFPLLKIFNTLKVFILVTIAWVFFRAANMNEAMQMMKLMFNFDGHVDAIQLYAGKGAFNFGLTFLVIIFLMLAYFLPKDLRFKNMKRNVAFLSLFIFLLFVLSKDATGDFIYFQF
jgi:D-alanyl-lipoteichoic acid acyltransferase DltB (MBOAT superfamily)